LIVQASADDLSIAQAVLEGLKKYHQRTGKVPTLIHTVRCFHTSLPTLAFLIDHVSSLELVCTVYHKQGNVGRLLCELHLYYLAFITDDARGLTAEHVSFSDLEVERLNAIPETALHRNVDVALIKADNEGYVKTYIVTPGMCLRLESLILKIWTDVPTPYSDSLWLPDRPC
jgi:hypothetical protein